MQIGDLVIVKNIHTQVYGNTFSDSHHPMTEMSLHKNLIDQKGIIRNIIKDSFGQTWYGIEFQKRPYIGLNLNGAIKNFKGAWFKDVEIQRVDNRYLFLDNYVSH